jgi:transmembrane protein EpsG
MGSLFHISALVFIPLYFVGKLKNTKLLFGATLLLFPVIFTLKNYMALALLATSNMEERFSAYSEQYHRGGSLILTAFQIILGIYAIMVLTKVLKIKPIAYKMYNTFALALFFLPLQWVNPSAGRIAQYFAIIIMVFIPYILDATAGESQQSRKGLYVVITIGFFIITLFTIGDLYDYKFFWQDMNVRFPQ